MSLKHTVMEISFIYFSKPTQQTVCLCTHYPFTLSTKPWMPNLNTVRSIKTKSSRPGLKSLHTPERRGISYLIRPFGFTVLVCIIKFIYFTEKGNALKTNPALGLFF